ncbi:MAG: hypothetical protein ACLGH0_00040 [Thermoanaerobaculia bacterium]
MRTALVVLCLLISSPAFARTAAEIDALLRSSCYCIGCTSEDVPNLRDARCRFIRWGKYPWINPVPGVRNDAYHNRLNSEFGNFTTFIHDFNAIENHEGVVEFVLPEIFTAGVEVIVIEENLRAPLQALGFVSVPIDQNFRFSFEAVKHPGRDDRAWNSSPDVERNSVPSLVTAQGKLYAAYLAARAMMSGAQAIGFGQPQLRVDSSLDLKTMVRKLRALRDDLARRNLLPAGVVTPLFGASATAHIPRRPGLAPGEPYTATDPLRSYIDYAKTTIDMDAYQVASGARFVKRHTGERVPCELLATAALNNELLPLVNGREYMCMISISQRERETYEPPRQVRTIRWADENPYHLRVLLELDGSQKCYDKTTGARVWYDERDPNYKSDCHQAVRNALPTTMFFLTRGAAARRQYLKYMVAVARKLTTSQRKVFFPVPIRMDQNEMAFVLEKNGCTRPCDPACTGDYVRPTQVQLIRACPSQENPDGLFCNFATKHYLARDCTPDFATIKTLLP